MRILKVSSYVLVSSLFLPSLYADDATVTIRMIKRLDAADELTCGVDCLYIVARMFGKQVDFSKLISRAEVPSKGLSLHKLIQLAREEDLDARAVMTTLKTLQGLKKPAILHVNGHHYIILAGGVGEDFTVIDTSLGLFLCKTKDFPDLYNWQGVAILFEEPPKSKLRLLLLFLIVLGMAYLCIRLGLKAYRSSTRVNA